MCPVRGCPRITWDLIKHFVWFDNPQSSIRAEDLNTTRDCFLKTIPVDQIIFPMEWIWFEDDERLSLEKEELVYDFIVSNLNEDYQDLLDLDQTEQASSFIDFSSGIPQG